jgi:protocatechuate 3,4-dioxygenase beta subunit
MTSLVFAALLLAPPAPPERAVLSGVVRALGGRPLEGALVTAWPSEAGRLDPLAGARTDAAGRFNLRVMTPAVYRLRVEARGFAAQTLEARPGATVAVTLQPGGSITGVVRDGTNGRVVAGARVEAREEASIPLPASEPEAGTIRASTDAAGAFRLEGVSRGLHAIAAYAKGYGRVVRTRVPPGARLDLFLFPGASLSGRVLAPDKKPLKDAVVHAESETALAAPARPGRTDVDGRFELLGLRPGAYRIVARHPDFAPAVAGGLVLASGGEQRADLVLQLGSRVAGRLVGASGRPARGRVYVQELDGQPAGPLLRDALQAEAASDGRFAISHVPPGVQTIAVLSPGHASRRLEVRVRAGDSQVDLGVIELETGLTIRGTVRDGGGSPVAGADVRALQSGPGGAPSGRLVEARSDADGAFVLAGLNPGGYRVMAAAGGYGRVNRQAEAGAEDVELVLDAAGAITGTVVDAGGRPVESFRVDARPARRETGPFAPSWSTSSATADGRFMLEGVGAGTHVVEISAPDSATATVAGVKVEPGSTTDLGQVSLQAGGVVRGTVRNPAGEPVIGATVDVLGATGRLSLGWGPQAVSDVRGFFELRGVAAGAAEVLATHPNYAEERVRGLTVGPSAAPLELAIVMKSGGTVEGRVRSREGTGIPGALVRVTSLSSPTSQALGPPLGTGVTNAEGLFAVEHIAAGPVRVMLVGRDLGSNVVAAQSRDLEVRDSETIPVEFVLRPVVVSGRVMRGGTPVPNARVTLTGGPPVARPPISLAGLGALSDTPGPSRMTAVTRDDGGYELLVDAPGSFRAQVETASTPSPAQAVEIPDVARYTLDLQIPGVVVSGVVVEDETGEPIPQASVSATAKSPRPGTVTAAAGQDGRFRMELEAGEYRLEARARGYSPGHADLTVDPAGETDTRIPLQRGLSLTGRVVDHDGRGVQGAAVFASSEPQGRDAFVGEAATSFDGSFRIEGLPPRTYALLAGADSIGFAFRPGVTAGEEGIVLALTPGGRVRLQVLAPDGTPAAGAHAMLHSVAGLRFAAAASATTDASGLAEVRLPEGRVVLRVMKGAQSSLVMVEVAAGGEETVEVKLPEGRPAR